MRLLISCLILFTLVSNLLLSQTDSIGEEKKGKPIIQVFGNFDYNATKDAQKKYSFWFGRAHFGYEYQFNKQFAGRVILDIGRPTTVGQIEVTDTSGNNLNVSNTSKVGSYYTMTLKFASLEWKPNEHVKLQAGGILQNHYIAQEKFWGYRYLAETFQDRYYKIPSSDLGIIGFFNINKIIAFDLALTNGEGFRFDQDPYGHMKIAGGLDLNLVKGLQLRLYYHNKSSGDSINNATEQLFSFFTGYKLKEKFRIGFEYNYMQSLRNISGFNSGGISIYGSYCIFKKIEVFARYDRLNYYEPDNVNLIGVDTGDAVITGLHYAPVKGVNVSLNYQGWFEKNSITTNHVLLSFEYML